MARVRGIASLDSEFRNFLVRLDEAWYGWFRWQLDLAGIELPEYDRRPPPFEPDWDLLAASGMEPPPDHSWLTYEKIRY